MLKILPAVNLSQQAKAKCGEIFCHSSTDFSIYCTFCDMKAFTFEDFLLHIQNVHFDNNILKTETCQQFLKADVKNEPVEKVWDNLEQIFEETEDNLAYDDYAEVEEEEELKSILKRLQKPSRNNRNKGKRVNDNSFKESDQEEDYDHSSDEDFKPELNIKNSTKLPPKETTSYTCQECNKTFKNPGLLKIHHKNKHEVEKTAKNLEKIEKKAQKQLCAECQQIFSNKKELDQHVCAEHDGYKCKHCDKRFKQSYQHKSHERSHTAERVLICPYANCGKTYIDNKYLERHINNHNPENKYICDFENCGKEFQNRKRLTVHKRNHTKPKNLICDTCGYSCRLNETLRVHQRTHTGEKPFACDVCHKRFPTQSAVVDHKASHSNARPHICKVCNASFAHQKSLYHHNFLHSDVKKFRCKLCDCAYKQAAGLAAHMRKHREEDMITKLPETSSMSSAAALASSAAVMAIAPNYTFTM